MVKHLPTLLLSSFLIRSLIFGANVGDSIALISLCGLFGFFYYLEHKKESPVNEKIKLQLEALKEEMNQLKSTVNGVKLGVTIGRK